MNQFSEPTRLWTPITTKLHRPAVTVHFVARPRLVDQLDRGLACPLTLVCAGAGYGKTALVSGWLAEKAAAGDESATLPAAWLSLDQYDSDLVTFVRYFCAALRTILPGSCAQTLALVEAPQPPPLNTVVATLTNEVEALPEDFMLVLDDFHAIDSIEVADLFAALARYWPRHLHLVLITRHSPLLPLASMRAKGTLIEIRTRDLKLTAPELAQYVTHILGQSPSDAVLAKLERHTEGWFVGVNLAALTLSGDVDATRLDALLASDADVADYLMDELLSQQPPDVMTFLLKTSLLNRFCARLCEQIIDGFGSLHDVRARLNGLERANFLIVPLDDRGEWYRYHHLVQDLLRSRAADEFGTKQVSELRSRASAWFARQGLVDDALQHALAAHDLDLAAGLMERGLCDVLNRDDVATLRRWMAWLPEDLRARRPGLLLSEAWLSHFSWRLPRMAQLLQELETLLAEDAEKLTEGEVRILRGNALALQGQLAHFENQPARALALMEEALTLLPQPWTYVRGGCVLYLGLSSQALGQGDDVNELLWARYEAVPDKSDAMATRILQALCFNTFQAGQLERARQIAALMLVQAQRGNKTLLVGWAHYWLGIVHYEWGELQAAEPHFQAIASGRFEMHTLTARHGMFGLLRVQLANGEYARAEETLQLARRYDLDISGFEAPETLSVRAGLQCLHGETTEALRWADAFAAPVPDQPLYWLENAHMTKARLLLLRGAATDLQAARQVIDRLYEIAERTHNRYAQIRLLALRALALQGQGHDRGAIASLERALELAQPGGFIRIFVDLGPPMQALLGRVDSQGPFAEGLRRVLARFRVREQGPMKGILPRPNPPLLDSLTPRELEILELLRQRWSNKEIASKLGITLETTERHLANLYGKLDVHTRRDAVAKADEIGIPPQP